MNFSDGYNLKIGDNVEKKGKFNYLSWVFAVKELRENHPDATWLIHETDAGAPCFGVPGGYMVKVSVVLDGKSFTQFHPVLDNRNNSIKEPNPFQINTSIQRCLTKAIGLATGIGLPLYAGEDLPTEEKKEEKESKILPIDVEKAISEIDKFADAEDTRPPAERISALKALWFAHCQPRLELSSKKSQTDLQNNYNCVLAELESQVKDMENG